MAAASKREPSSSPTSRQQEQQLESLDPGLAVARATATTVSLDVDSTPRQVIAVSASKGPAAFFNLARKFLVTDEMCDLSALEGAIVSAVDAAHLLERSKLATIVRIHTSYVSVEPKRWKPSSSSSHAIQEEQSTTSSHDTASQERLPPSRRTAQTVARSAAGGSGRELRRARVVITVQRTESYKQWLEENPLQAIIAGDGDEPESPIAATR